MRTADGAGIALSSNHVAVRSLTPILVHREPVDGLRRLMRLKRCFEPGEVHRLALITELKQSVSLTVRVFMHAAIGGCGRSSPHENLTRIGQRALKLALKPHRLLKMPDIFASIPFRNQPCTPQASARHIPSAAHPKSARSL